MQIGVLLVPQPRRTAHLTRLIEDLGFDSLVFVDSQNLAPEVWSHLLVAAGATTRIRLSPGVSNSITRDPAVSACAALTLHAESQGRAVLALGRGEGAGRGSTSER